jgi:uncharacterized iron-regulated protein
MSHLDPTVLTQLITAGIALITAVATLIVAIANRISTKANASKIDENTKITRQTASATDGIVTQLVASTKTASFAEGVKDQVDRQTDIQTAVNAAKGQK